MHKTTGRIFAKSVEVGRPSRPFLGHLGQGLPRTIEGQRWRGASDRAPSRARAEEASAARRRNRRACATNLGAKGVFPPESFEVLETAARDGPAHSRAHSPRADAAHEDTKGETKWHNRRTAGASEREGSWNARPTPKKVSRLSRCGKPLHELGNSCAGLPGHWCSSPPGVQCPEEFHGPPPTSSRVEQEPTGWSIHCACAAPHLGANQRATGIDKARHWRTQGALAAHPSSGTSPNRKETNRSAILKSERAETAISAPPWCDNGPHQGSLTSPALQPGVEEVSLTARTDQGREKPDSQSHLVGGRKSLFFHGFETSVSKEVASRLPQGTARVPLGLLHHVSSLPHGEAHAGEGLRLPGLVLLGAVFGEDPPEARGMT